MKANKNYVLVTGGASGIQYRLDKAKRTTNSETILWQDKGKEAIEEIRSMTNNRGADLCVDAVGFEPARSFIDKAFRNL